MHCPDPWSNGRPGIVRGVTGLRLHLGCGPRLLPGFVNIDQLDYSSDNYRRWDLADGLPPLLSGADLIYSEHFWEHMEWEDGLRLMRECWTALNEGGVFRMALPNFRNMAKRYLADDLAFFDMPGVIEDAPDRQMMQIMNFGLYQVINGIAEHKCMYDPEFGDLHDGEGRVRRVP